ncbi:MAG: imidazole glycerol phosphate synthase subunit HisH [Chloroflexi bacterium]|nr:imidazole glycerol phosphate synthase subunit HisH [Chloroflexota bacterium]
MACWTATWTPSSRHTWRGAWGVPKPPPDTPEIVVVDYDAGNLRSVQRALEAVGQRPRVTPDWRDVEAAEALVLPGVGSAQDCMRKLADRRLVEPLKAYAASGRPFLGVCVGLQLLYDGSEEGGGVECLGILPGTVRRFPTDTGLKVPQIGWNSVSIRRPHPILEDIPDATYFYFVHSYYADPSEIATVIGSADYGLEFAAIVARDNVVATQFHPEKSADLGLRLYANFGRIAANALGSSVHAYSRR